MERFSMTESEEKASSSLPRRDWHVVAANLEPERDRVKRTQLLQELVDSIWLCNN